MPVVTLQKMPPLKPGERAILVDGVRWGRTIIAHRGRRGTSYSFSQDGGEMIMEQHREGGKFYEVKVHSLLKQHRIDSSDIWRPTEELVREKAQQLVDSGLLRDPEIVRKEAEERRVTFSKALVTAQAKEDERFLERAKQALHNCRDRPLGDVLNEVVKAMKWAQEQ